MIELFLTGQALLWIVVLGIFLASGQASLFHPLTLYLAFHGLVFVVRPVLVCVFGFDTIWNYMRLYPTEEDLIKTLGVTSVALVVFSGCSLAFGWTRLAYATPAPLPFTPVQRRALGWTTLLLVPLVLYSMRSLSNGGLSGEHRGGTFVLTGASGYTLEAQYMAAPLICAWLAVARFRGPVLVPMALYVAYRTYNGWNRWTVVLFFLAVAMIYAWQKRIRWVPAWFLVAALPLFLVFQTLGRNRDYFKQWVGTGHRPVQMEETTSIPEAERLKLKYDTQEFANFDFLCYIVKLVPERTQEFTYGSQYAQLFTEPIPRKLWPGKPAGAPIRSFNLNSYGNFLGLTPSLPGDGWMSGGWIGVIITLGLVGCFLGWTHRFFWRHAQNNFVAVAYSVGLAMLPQWYRDGGISIAKFLFWNLSPLLLWLGMTWLCGRKLVPVSSMLLPRGARVRIIESTANAGLPGKTAP